MKRILILSLAVLLAGCGASTQVVGTTKLPTSGLPIDIVQHRSSTYDGCAELVVLQTFDSNGKLIDSKEGRGRTLGCTVVEVGIEAGSRLGSATIIGNAMIKAAKATRPDEVNIENAISSTQTQGQSQLQLQGQAQKANGQGGQGSHGNNGNGNGDNDGTNPGTNHHHDNGDNN